MATKSLVSKHAFLLISPSGNSYVIQGIEIIKCAGSYGYDLCVVRETGEKVGIAWSSPERDALVPIRETVLEHMKEHPGEPFDMRGKYMSNPDYIGYYGCTVVPNKN